MKFGRLNFDKFIYDAYVAENSERVTINVGDAMQMLSINRLFKEMCIPEEQIIDISLHELETYQGEYLILPINWLVSNNTTGHNKLFNVSNDIIPIYLGISISDLNLAPRHLENLKKNEPIGCRDERTLKYLRKNGITSYLSGCMAALYTDELTNAISSEKHIFFVDVPKSIKSFIPQQIIPKIRFFSQELYASLTEIPNGYSPSEWVHSILMEYKEHASLIVTSRFHGAVIGLALDIPVIITLENYTYRFSWLKKLLPFYTPDTFNKIDWNPKCQNFQELKQTMMKVAIKRISDSYEKYADIYKLSNFLETRQSEEENATNQTLYYESAIKFIKNNWDPNIPIDYAFWGINVNTEYIYNYIGKNYPMAKLTAVYDMFRTIDYHGILSIPPDEINQKTVPFIFVTSYIASMYATTFFNKNNISKEKYFLCEREFLCENDILKLEDSK